MSESFDWARVNTVGPVFDLDKLGWLNGHYLRELARATTSRRARCRTCSGPGWWTTRPPRSSSRCSPARCRSCSRGWPLLSELPALLRFLFVPEEEFAVDPAAAAKALGEGSAAVLLAAADALEPVQDWTTEGVQAAVDGGAARRAGAQAGQGVPAAAGGGVRREHLAAAAGVDGAAGPGAHAAATACGGRGRLRAGRPVG